MSKNKNQFTERAEEALNSVNKLERADPGPWFYARVMNRLHQSQETFWEKTGAWLTRPVMLLATLFIILFINGFFLLQPSADHTARSAIQQELPDSESLLASNSSFEYEKLVQP